MQLGRVISNLVYSNNGPRYRKSIGSYSGSLSPSTFHCKLILHPTSQPADPPDPPAVSRLLEQRFHRHRPNVKAGAADSVRSVSLVSSQETAHTTRRGYEGARCIQGRALQDTWTRLNRGLGRAYLIRCSSAWWWVTDIARVFQKRDVDVTVPGQRGLAPLFIQCIGRQLIRRYLCRTLGGAGKARTFGRQEIPFPADALARLFGFETSRRRIMLAQRGLRTAMLFDVRANY